MDSANQNPPSEDRPANQQHGFFDVTVKEDVMIVRLSGIGLTDGVRVDHLNVALMDLLNGTPHDDWVIDLSAVSYASSSMLGVLVNALQRVKQNDGLLVLCGLNDGLVRTFRTCCLERLFIISVNVHDALVRIGDIR